MIYRLFGTLAPRAGAALLCQRINITQAMARSKRAAVDSGAQRGRAQLQANSEVPQPTNKGSARSGTSRTALRSSTLNQRRHVASIVRVNSEPAGDVSVSLSKEVQSEHKVLAALAQAVKGEENEHGRPVSRQGKRARGLQSTPVQVKQEHGEEGAEPGKVEKTDGTEGTRGNSKGRKAPKKAALSAEQQEDAGISVKPKKKRKIELSPQEAQAAAAEDSSKAKPKQRRQRKAKPEQSGQEGMPEVPDAEQCVRKAAAAAPRRRKAAARLDAGADMADILDGEVAVAELLEGDIEGEIELVDITRVVPTGKLVGAHVSMSNGIARAVINAASIGAKAFALDTRSKRQWHNPPLSNANAAAFRLACNEFGFSPAQILPHGSYLINLGSPDDEMMEKSYTALVEELRRCEKLGIELYNIHPGHHNRVISPEECMLKIAATINRAHKETSGVCVVLENVAGGGSSVGHSFEQLRLMIDHVHDQSRVGVCLDTCHMFAAGYDISTKAGYRNVMEQFGEIVGWRYLKGMHVNDSKAALGSKRDRHENIGRGLIGIGLFDCLMNDPRLDGIPLIMETPSQASGPKLNYPKSLLTGKLVYREDVNEIEESTDCRDVKLLYSLIK